MKNKRYYIELVEKYFNAETSESEEIRLRRFLADTDDEDFDDVKAVMGYTALRKRMETTRVSRNMGWAAYAVCCCLVAAAVIIPSSINSDRCYVDYSGERITDSNIVMDAVDEQLTQFFSAGDNDSDVDSSAIE
ncbi:MAG: hypothetical protein MJY97_07350 [Bacteroidales bacterium]|nr:hypothetical protein [Bacteroidales bacterium]